MKLTWVGSPNYDTNRKPVDRIVIHWIVGTLASADAQFQKTTPGTSAHYGIEDENIHQYVKETNVAYHAGVYTMNQRSIGIEHSASPDRPASDKTYETSAQLISEISQHYNIPLDREHIIKHSEVKNTACPGTMDLDRLIRMAKDRTTNPLKECLIQHTQLVNELEDVKKTIAGHQSRATTMERERDSARGDLAVEKEKHKLTKDELAKKDEECQQQIGVLNARIDELSKASPDLESLRAEYEGQIGVLKDLIFKIEKKNRELSVTIAKLKQPIKALPFMEKFKILFS